MVLQRPLLLRAVDQPEIFSAIIPCSRFVLEVTIGLDERPDKRSEKKQDDNDPKQNEQPFGSGRWFVHRSNGVPAPSGRRVEDNAPYLGTTLFRGFLSSDLRRGHS
jgi:hypothetical protein